MKKKHHYEVRIKVETSEGLRACERGLSVEASSSRSAVAIAKNRVKIVAYRRD